MQVAALVFGVSSGRPRSVANSFGGAITARHSDFFRFGLDLAQEFLADSNGDIGSPRERSDRT